MNLYKAKLKMEVLYFKILKIKVIIDRIITILLKKKRFVLNSFKYEDMA